MHHLVRPWPNSRPISNSLNLVGDVDDDEANELAGRLNDACRASRRRCLHHLGPNRLARNKDEDDVVVVDDVADDEPDGDDKFQNPTDCCCTFVAVGSRN